MEPAPRYCYRHPDRETGLSCSECGRPICYECMTPAPVGLRCPEHSGKPQGIQKVTVAAERAVTGVGSRRGDLITLILIGINVLVYLIEVGKGTVDGASDTLFRNGALVGNGLIQNGLLYGLPKHAVYPGAVMIGVSHGDWWRLITSAFLHESIIHLGLNMLGLYFGGRILEPVIGRWRFVLVYFVSAVAGSAGALLLTPNAPTIGASGAIFGVFGALLVLERQGTIATGGQVLVLIVINLVFSFSVSGISVGGHIGGLVAGIVLMLAFVHFRRSWQASVATAALVASVAVIVAYASI
jgi:membrane associated rhomboid family serine protease